MRACFICFSNQWNMDDSHLNINGVCWAEASQIEVLKKLPKHFLDDIFTELRLRLMTRENVGVRGGRGRFNRNS